MACSDGFAERLTSGQAWAQFFDSARRNLRINRPRSAGAIHKRRPEHGGRVEVLAESTRVKPRPTPKRRQPARFPQAAFYPFGDFSEVRVARGEFRPGVADADHRASGEHSVRLALIFHSAAVDETVAVVAAEPFLAAQFFLRPWALISARNVWAGLRSAPTLSKATATAPVPVRGRAVTKSTLTASATTIAESTAQYARASVPRIRVSGGLRFLSERGIKQLYHCCEARGSAPPRQFQT